MKIYVVEGSTGQYSDHHSWLVIAYRNKAKAEEHAQQAGKYSELLCNCHTDKDERDGYFAWFDLPYDKRKNPYDPHWHTDYTGTSYCVRELELVDD